VSVCVCACVCVWGRDDRSVVVCSLHPTRPPIPPPPPPKKTHTKQDIATSDSIFLRQSPPADAAPARTALRRLQESGVGVIVPVAELKAKPVPNAIALFTLGEVPAVGGGVGGGEGEGKQGDVVCIGWLVGWFR
jgi:hypothetical protein